MQNDKLKIKIRKTKLSGLKFMEYKKKLKIKILIFLHGTIIMHRTTLGKSREEIVKQVKNHEDSVYDYLSYIPISKSVEKLKRWKKQGAEIHYLSALKVGKKIKENQILKKENLKIDQVILRKYGFPKGKIFHRNEEETYAEIAERVLPDVLIEDNCESIGGSKEMAITFIKPEIKRKIRSIVVKEFGGIDHLPDKLNDLLNYND